MSNPWPPRWDDGITTWDGGWKWPTQAELDYIRTTGKNPYQPKRMKKQYYYPSRIADQIPWLENFRLKVAGYTVILGLDPAKVTGTVAGARYLVYILSDWLPAVRAFGPAATAALDDAAGGDSANNITLPAFNVPPLPNGVVAVPPGILTRLFDLVADIKNADAYNETIGQDLQIISSGGTNTASAPTIRLEVMQGTGCECVKINFRKFGHMGVHLESRRAGGAWEFLAIDTESPYMDERPLLVPAQPEVREYRARFWDKGTPNGDWTDVAKVTVA